jgi:tetratricopeptide (TPR) repeat protein
MRLLTNLALLAWTAACTAKPSPDSAASGGLGLLSAVDVARVDSILSNPQRLSEDAFGQPIDTIDRRELLRMLRAAQYDSLEAILNERWEATQRDIRNEARLVHAYDAFLHGNGVYEEPIKQWVAARPSSGAALVALTMYYSGRSSEARGSGTARTTKQEQFDEAQRFADEGMRAGDAALRLVPNHLVVYGEQLSMLLHGGATDRERAPLIVRAALSAHPASYELRSTILWMLQPRWGGSYEAMDAFAATANQFVAVNPKLRVTAGAVARDQADRATSDSTQALALLQQASAYGEHYSLDVEYGELYSIHSKLVDALAYMQRAIALAPQGRNAHEERGKLLVDIGALIADSAIREKAWTEAERSLKLMRDLRAPNSEAVRWLAALTRIRERCAKWPAPCKRVT